jgi:DNA polymerase-3 subunit epsilon
MQRAKNERQIWETVPVEYSLEQMARSLVESGDYRVTSRLEPQVEYNPPDDIPKLVAAVVDVETTGTNPDRDKIIELGICLFEYDRQSGRIYNVLGSWEWFEDPGVSILPEITNITGITDEMVSGHRIDDRAVNDLLSRVVLVIAHNADFDRRFLEKRLPAFATKHWACSRFDIDLEGRGDQVIGARIRGLLLGVFPRRPSGRERLSSYPTCIGSTATRAGRLALQVLLERARLPTCRIWGAGRQHREEGYPQGHAVTQER